MRKLLLIILLAISGCTRIAHIDEAGDIVIDRPDLYSATAKMHEDHHLLGLYHCWNNKCVMYFMDKGSVVLCPKCKSKLRTTTSGWLDRITK
ncbi:hypothetical protein LCGC14_2409190 [marine sediment metagenome]|uniref:Uncharacterized protein n=1 Tax=marine sediment metagenome TaxID=412755 RepID=A0A0F9CF46_9ZZZZ